MVEAGTNFDLIVIGGGINGAGVARDAAGRGLSVLLVEKNDLASATSSWSSKLIHGGLRYLEQYEFRLVAEALAEREILLNIASHLVKPMRFVMPHVPALRPRWMIRAGLFLYDHLGNRATKTGRRNPQLLGSKGVRLNVPPYGNGIKSEFTNGFIYSDCQVDDSRLVLTNALSAAEHGAKVMTRTECVSGKRENGAWKIELHTRNSAITVTATAVVNAAGPWVKGIQYLCAAVNRYLEKPISPNQVLWSYAGIRPLYDDGSANPSAVTRDYTLRLDADNSEAPVLSVFGGKITTYRKLAEHVLEKLSPWFPEMKPAWTAEEPLPGSEPATKSAVSEPWRTLPKRVLDALISRHGTRIAHVLQRVESVTDLGAHFGQNLYAREINYMIDHEWAFNADDVLYRRSKVGPLMTAEQRAAVTEYVTSRLATN